jgi:flavodoxin
MKIKPISRRKFISGIATAAGATLLVACVPATLASSGDTDKRIEPLPAGDAALAEAASRTIKVFIVYDSVYGNTAKIAEAMIAAIGGNEESRILRVQEASAIDLENIDLLMVGSPTQAGSFIEPVKKFLAGIPAGALQNVSAAAFDTSFDINTQKAFLRFIMKTFGYAAPKIAKELSGKGATVLATETFIVLETEGPLQDGEVERAKGWASAVIKKVLET